MIFACVSYIIIRRDCTRYALKREVAACLAGNFRRVCPISNRATMIEYHGQASKRAHSALSAGFQRPCPAYCAYSGCKCNAKAVVVPLYGPGKPYAKRACGFPIFYCPNAEHTETCSIQCLVPTINSGGDDSGSQ